MGTKKRCPNKIASSSNQLINWNQKSFIEILKPYFIIIITQHIQKEILWKNVNQLQSPFLHDLTDNHSNTFENTIDDVDRTAPEKEIKLRKLFCDWKRLALVFQSPTRFFRIALQVARFQFLGRGSSRGKCRVVHLWLEIYPRPIPYFDLIKYFQSIPDTNLWHLRMILNCLKS